MTCSGDAEELCIGMWDFFLSLLGFRRTMTEEDHDHDHDPDHNSHPIHLQ